LYINEVVIDEKLDESLQNKITKEKALKISEKICGKGYTFDYITENPYDFDILYKKYVDGVEVLGGDCYVSINSKTGKVGAYRKLVFDMPKLKKPKVPKNVIESNVGMEANLVVIPHINRLFWMTDERMSRLFDASTGKEVGKAEGKKIMNDVMRTDKGIGNLDKKFSGSGYSTMSVNNNQGAVFRDDISVTSDDINKAEASMEKQRPNGQPAWDYSVNNYGVVYYKLDVDYILKQYEGVYFSGHGTNNCIEIGGIMNYCSADVDYGLQTRLFVVSACYAGNNFATTVNNRGVTCVIGGSGEVTDSLLWDECGNWADHFWDRATGNTDAGYQRSAHNARVQANSATWLNICDLDTEKGSCGIYI